MGETHAPTVGYSEAVERCGAPLERNYVYDVAPQAFDNRQQGLGKRDAEVVLVVRRPNGRYLLHTKSFYPPGTFRLLTGGVKRGEPLLAAVQRELYEETGRGGRLECFLGVQRHTFRLGERAVPFTSFVFLVAGGEGALAPTDADEGITAFREVTLDGLIRAAEQLEALPLDWVDWGRFRATAHRLVAEVLPDRGGGA